MNRLARIGLVLLLAASAARAETEGPTADDVVRRLQERYDATSDFTADFTQEVEVPTLERTLESHGRVLYKRPGKMRWEFLQPEPQTIVADGEKLWIWQPEQNQVLRAPFRAAFRSSTPVSFLFGVGKLAEDFDATIASAGDGAIRLRLEPKKDTDIGTVFLTVRGDTADLQGAEITDPLGNVTRLRFSNLEREVGLEDSRFEFEIPDGADVVESPAMFE